MAPSPAPFEAAPPAADLAFAIGEALGALQPLHGDGAWVLIVGCRDRRLARGLTGVRVVRSDQAVGLSLPRGSFHLAIRVAAAPADLDELVVVRNALAGDAALLVIEAAHRLATTDEIAEVAGFSRRRARLLSNGFGVLELQR